MTTVTKQEYKAAADRVRTGRALPGDDATCDAFEAALPTAAPKSTSKRSAWYDLPVAKWAWGGDAAVLAGQRE